jgi:hypothetical protein
MYVLCCQTLWLRSEDLVADYVLPDQQETEQKVVILGVAIDGNFAQTYVSLYGLTLT